MNSRNILKKPNSLKHRCSFIHFFFRRYSLLSFGISQMYNLEALSFTYRQYVDIELADKLCYCLFLCLAKVCLFQVVGRPAGDRTTDPWITRPELYPYNTGDSLHKIFTQLCSTGITPDFATTRAKNYDPIGTSFHT